MVSASLYTDIINLTFCGNHADDFATGISPFAVADGSDAHRASNLKAAEIQRAMLEGGTNMSPLAYLATFWAPCLGTCIP